MFGMDMYGTHADRVVDNYEFGKLIIDTCSVTDSDQPYETAVQHPSYNEGSWVIVELYDDKEKAQVGHDKWVLFMTGEKLPDELKDVSSAEVIKLGSAFGCDMNETHKQK